VTVTVPAPCSSRWHWKGAGGTGGSLPNGTFATTTEVPVQEIQAVNR
jgi:hypothetical protein